MSKISPIADLTYRGYDGPLNTADRRWWAIAKMTMRLSIKKKGFWVWAAFSAWGYVLMMAGFYFMEIAGVAMPNGKNPILGQLVWRDQVVIGYSMAQLMLFILAMVIGIGQIANDNQANALLVYLSKPCTKLDYLIGKWLGVFVPLYAVTLAPCLIFWAYIAMSFREYGSVSSAPYLPFQIILMSAVPAFLLSSLCMGISSLFKDGRLAGATFAGVYFLPNFFTWLMQGIYQPHVPASDLVRNLYYASVDGISIGIGKLICLTDGSAMFGQRGQRGVTIGAPNELLAFVVFFGISAFCVLIAWLRIRPVEVVG